MDRKFESIGRLITGISTVNDTAASEHVPEIEQQIRVTKEHARAIWITLPFNKVPGHIVINMILLVVMWLNFSVPLVGYHKNTHLELSCHILI